MAKRTNKTDHVLNLLSTGHKKNGTGAEKKDKSAPPVKLKKKSSENEAEEGVAIPETAEETELPDIQETSGAPDAPKAVGGKETPAVAEVSVVVSSNEESPIADAVKDSLEAELEAYLKEENETGNAELFSSMEENTMRGPEPDTDLPDITDVRDSRDFSDLPDLPDLPDTAEVQEIADDLPDLPDLTDTVDSSEPAEFSQPEIVDSVIEDVVSQADVTAAAQEIPAQDTGAIQEETPAVQEAQKAQAEGHSVEENTVEMQQEQPEPIKEPEPQTKEAEVPETKETASEEAEPEPPEPKEEEQEFTTVNILEQLVQVQALKYIRQFGHCDCPRCVADTVALALTHLPPKYVVVNKAAVSPLLNFYEKKYAGQMLVEITKASMIVNEFPHH